MNERTKTGASRQAERAIHLIDLENLAGVARLTEDAAGWAIWSYLRSVVVGADDLVVIAVDASNAFAAFAACPNARLLLGHGRDGADRKLLSVMAEEGIERRFAHLYIASGDGIFEDEAGRLVGLGMMVTVVALPGHDSRRLRRVSSEMRYIGLPATRVEVH